MKTRKSDQQKKPFLPACCTSPHCCLLGTVKPGETVVLRGVQAGCGLSSRLAAMGLVPGVMLNVCQNYHHGPVVVGVKGQRLMLGRGMAEHIYVE